MAQAQRIYNARSEKRRVSTPQNTLPQAANDNRNPRPVPNSDNDPRYQPIHKRFQQKQGKTDSISASRDTRAAKKLATKAQPKGSVVFNPKQLIQNKISSSAKAENYFSAGITSLTIFKRLVNPIVGTILITLYIAQAVFAALYLVSYLIASGLESIPIVGKVLSYITPTTFSVELGLAVTFIAAGLSILLLIALLRNLLASWDIGLVMIVVFALHGIPGLGLLPLNLLIPTYVILRTFFAAK